MIYSEFENIKASLERFNWSSMNYVEYEQLEQYDVIQNNDDAILVFGVNEAADMHELYWAANDYSPIVGAVKGCGKSVLVSFVPEEWKTNFSDHGFVEYGAMREYWIDHLSVEANVPNYVMMTDDEAELASNVTMSCQGQSREYHGETPDWIRSWINGTEVNALATNASDCAVLVNREESGMNGIVCVAIYGHNSDKGAIVWIRELAVKPESQGKGIGRKLLLQGLRYGEERGAKRAFLMADECNVHAVRLYQNTGFVPNMNEIQLDMLYEVVMNTNINNEFSN